ncbi:MAG: N-acetylmuramoyl-L-alanine amidase [Spirochaetaceae bacterium]|jgi:N-acetylmuramoyl-L-alanine amidase|nr:N-acetylmuramoyl-L-alanine amidase [Spirochaetaceae bacterium]
MKYFPALFILWIALSCSTVDSSTDNSVSDVKLTQPFHEERTDPSGEIEEPVPSPEEVVQNQQGDESSMEDEKNSLNQNNQGEYEEYHQNPDELYTQENQSEMAQGFTVTSFNTNNDLENPWLNFIVLIDPGHGGMDSGAINGGITEKFLNGEVAYYLGESLAKQGFQVIFTRNSRDMDTTMGLQERVNLIERINPDIILSVHHNSNPSNQPLGYSLYWSSYRPWLDQTDIFVKRAGILYPWVREEIRNNITYVYYQDNTGLHEINGDNSYSIEDHSPITIALESYELALFINKHLHDLDFISAQNMSGKNEPIIDMENRVLRLNKHIAVLVECGFMSNQVELQSLIIPTNQQAMAESIAAGLMEYLIFRDVE